MAEFGLKRAVMYGGSQALARGVRAQVSERPHHLSPVPRLLQGAHAGRHERARQARARQQALPLVRHRRRRRAFFHTKNWHNRTIPQNHTKKNFFSHKTHFFHTNVCSNRILVF